MSQETIAKDADTIAIELLLKSPDAVQNPYPRYKALREISPRVRVEFPQGAAWVLTGYDDCRHALVDPKLGAEDHRPRVGDDRGEARPRTMMFMNREEHARQRGLVMKAFSKRQVQRLQPVIEHHVRVYLDDLTERIGPDGGEVNLVDDFAFMLPVAVIGDWMGVPSEDWHRLRRLTRQASQALELFAGPDDLKTADAALHQMEEYFAEVAERKRVEPQDDMLSSLVQVERDGERLSTQEIMSITVLLFSAGFQTSTDAIGNGTVALYNNPDQLAKMRADKSLLPSAIEELLRFDNPPHLLGRAVHEDTTWFDGSTLPAGENVLILLGAANHDPTHYKDPEKLDIGRFAVENPPDTPLSFSWGPHHCLGAQLARTELRIAFDGLINRFQRIEVLDDPLNWRRSNFRGLASLQVGLVPAPK